MPKFKRRGQHARIEELHPDHFSFKTTAFHGFPSSPTAISFEPEDQFLSIGTKNGEFRIYGRPGVEFRAELENRAAIQEIFSLKGLHQFITVSADNRLILWQLNGGDQTPCSLAAIKEYRLDPEGGKTITKCCLSQVNGNFYVGTEGGNVFILDLRTFILTTEVIYWNNATTLLSHSANPGSVKCLEVCPADPKFLLIGYDKGVICLWDINRGLPTKNFPASIQDCQQVREPLESLSWQNDGVKFVSSHSDSSIYFWAISSSSPSEGPTKHYDPGNGNCMPITKIKWLNTDQNPLLVFAGGIPTEQEDEHHTVTVIQGADHIALDFTSQVIDFITITDPSTHRGTALIVLCEHEIMAFDLEAPKCPQIRKPYLFTLHTSPVHCVRLYENCSSDLFVALHELNITSPPAHEHFSQMEWPAMGGCVRAAEATSFDILLTGHENGMVRFWDVTTGAMRLIYELKTANLFLGEDIDPALLDDFADFNWPPYRKVSSYDPFEDDARLSIKFIDFCPFSRTLCIGGAGGQVVTFALNPIPGDIKLQYERAEIFLGNQTRDRRAGLRKEQPLECKTETIHVPAGFQATFCLQCIPATPITALTFRPDWGLVAAGISKGFVVANFLVKGLVLIHPTVTPDGHGARSVNRVQSFRRSIRDSFRRRRSASTVADDRKKIAEALNAEAGIKSQGGGGGKQKGHRPRASSEPNSPVDIRSPADTTASSQVPPEMAGYVTHLAFYETHMTSSTCTPCLFAATKGSVMIRYSITLPPPRDRNVVLNKAVVAGKDYSLLHAAPIVAIFILDHEGVPIPDPNEVKHQLVPEPDNRSPHFAVICTQEQIKMVTLPGFKQKRKEKVMDSMHEKVLKAWVIRVKVAASPVGAPRDWNPALVLLTSVGNLLTYSLPDLRPIYEQEEVILPSDQKALQSLTISPYGEVLHLRSFTELERSLLCSYAIPFHTTMLPNLFAFEGSTPAVKGTRRASQPKIGGAAVGGAQQVVTADVETSSKRSATRSATRSPERQGEEGALVNGTSETSVEKRQDPEGASNAGPVPATNGHAPTTNGILSDHRSRSTSKERSAPPVTVDKEVANARAFIESVKKKRSVSVSSSSSSSSSDDSSDDDLPSPIAGNDDMTFGNPFAQVTFEELGDGSKELDNIIASSLQQLESARAFYEQMQARVKKSDN